jgi:hypothetical protein
LEASHVSDDASIARYHAALGERAAFDRAHDAHLAPPDDGPELDRFDQRDIDRDLEDAAKALAERALATYDFDLAAKALDYSNDAMECCAPAIAEICRAVIAHREPVSCLTDAERLDATIRDIRKALMPLARVLSERERDRLERECLAAKAAA